MRHIRKGFTLIELLIVIGVLIILASIILPVVNRSRESARQAACMSNQREVYVALQAYLKDNNDICPGSATGNKAGSGTPVTGTGTPTVFGVGQLISGVNSLPQATLERSSMSMMVARGYVKTGAIFHCPQQDTYAGMEAALNKTVATFHYVFNEYFVGDKPIVTTNVSGGNGAPNVCTPVYSPGRFAVTSSTQSPMTFNFSQNPSRCVLITEDGGGYDSTGEYAQTINGLKTYFLHATPWHNVHGAASTSTSTSGASSIADSVVCTYVDGHSEVVLAVPEDGQFVVPSDTTGLESRR